MTHSHVYSSWKRWRWLTLVVIVCARGAQSFEDRCSIHCCVVESDGERSAVNEFGGPRSLLGRGGLQSCQLRRRFAGPLLLVFPWHAAGARVEPHPEPQPEEERCRWRWSKLWLNLNKNYSHSELKWQQNLDLPMRCEQSTILPQLKFGKTLRVSLIRPKEFSGKEEDLQHWSKKTEAFFAGVINEYEMMLEWAAEQPTEITSAACDLEFLPTDTNEDGGVQNLEFVLHQMYTALMALTSYEANDIVANSRKNPLEAWRRLQNDMILEQEEGNRTFCARPFLRDGAFFWNSKQELNAGSPVCRATRRSWRTRWTTRSSWRAWRRWCRRSLGNIWFSTRIAYELLKMHFWISWRTRRRSLFEEFVIPSRVTRVLVDTQIS